MATTVQISNTPAVRIPMSPLAQSHSVPSDGLGRGMASESVPSPATGCPSAATGFRASVAATEAQAAGVVAACINPPCPWGMQAHSKAAEKLTIVCRSDAVSLPI